MVHVPLQDRPDGELEAWLATLVDPKGIPPPIADLGIWAIISGNTQDSAMPDGESPRPSVGIHARRMFPA